MKTKNNNKLFFLFIVSALLIKVLLWGYTTILTPNAKLQVDSGFYLGTAEGIAKKGAFAMLEGEEIVLHHYRTPGYPLFLALLNGKMNIALSDIVLIQLILTILAAWTCYKSAALIDERLKYLSILIVLYDPPTTIYSLMILTEALFIFIITLFMLSYLRYIKEKRGGLLIKSGIYLTLATFVRPVAIYLPVPLMIFSLCLRQEGVSWKRKVASVLLFLIIFYTPVTLWCLRNKNAFGNYHFSIISGATSDLHGLFGNNKDKIETEKESVSIQWYYAQKIGRSFCALMTTPGSLKYFGNRELKKVGKVFGYCFVAFWMTGLLIALLRFNFNSPTVFLWLMLFYFMAVSMVSTGVEAVPRFRVPMMPFIAILSAYGWKSLKFSK